MTPAQARLKSAGYHLLPWIADDRCETCSKRRQVAKKVRPLELRLACGKLRTTVEARGWCMHFERSAS